MSEANQNERRVSPLTADEKKWVSELENLFARMPNRLLLVECADSLMVVDKDAAKTTDMHDGGASRAGIVLRDVANSTFKCTSVSG